MSNINVNTFTASILGRCGKFLPLGWVWGESPLGPLRTLVTIMTMVVSGQGYRSALSTVFENNVRDWSNSQSIPSSAALTQARAKLSEKMLRDLFRRLCAEVTHVKSRAQFRYRDFRRCVAVDGTKAALKSTPKLKDAFGCPSGSHLAPQARLTVLWDLGGNVPVDWRFGAFDETETGHLDDMLGNLDGSDLLIGDRLFTSRDMMARCIKRGIHFIFRAKIDGKRTTKELIPFRENELDDQVVELTGYPGVKVRLTRAYLPDSTHIVLISSLMAKDGHTREAIADLYQRRWGIETAYREAKTWTKLENLPGHSKEHVRQEIAALMIYWLMQGELIGQTRETYAEEISAQPSVEQNWTPAEGICESPVRFNRALAATMISNIMSMAMVDMEKAVQIWKSNIEYLWRNRSRRKPGRHNRRTSERPHKFKKRDENSVSTSKKWRIKEKNDVT